MTPVPSPVTNVLSVDVEDYFHAEIFSDTVPRSSWESYPSRVERNTMRLLELFATFNVRATFFVLGWVAERQPRLVREIAAMGHEVACHSYWHKPIYKLNPDEFRKDTVRAKNVIEQALGQTVTGYRAPTFSIVKQSLWALDILAEEQFKYDSSIFPIRHDRYGIPEAPRVPFYVPTSAGPFLECPITTFAVFKKMNFPLGGGGYLRLLPEWYTRMGLKKIHAEGLALICYVHPWEIDPEQPRLEKRPHKRLRHYTNLSKTYDRLKRMLQAYRFTSFRDSKLSQFARECHLTTRNNHDHQC